MRYLRIRSVKYYDTVFSWSRTCGYLKMMCGMPQNDHDEEMDVAEELVNSQVDTPSPAVQSHWKRCDGNDCF